MEELHRARCGEGGGQLSGPLLVPSFWVLWRLITWV